MVGGLSDIGISGAHRAGEAMGSCKYCVVFENLQYSQIQIQSPVTLGSY